MAEENKMEMEGEAGPATEVELGVTPGPNAVDVKGDGKLWKEVLLQAPESEKDDLGARKGMEVRVFYKGSLVDGTVFDESDRNGFPFPFTLGQGSVIEAWDKGLVGVKRGEKIKLICHPDVAYKNAAQAKIPANSTLIFEVDVVDYTPEDMTKKKTGEILRYNVKEGGSKYLNPNHGSLVKILIRGKHGDNIVFPERTVEFKLGEGCDHNIPYGVEKALYKFTSSEGSVLVIKGSKYGLSEEELRAQGCSSDSPIEFYVELLSHENTKEPWQMDGPEKLVISRQLKEDGNKFFGKANYRVAFKNYKLIVDYLKAEALLVGDDEEERKKLLLAAYLNMAICDLKLNKPTIAIRSCEDALSLDADNAKALFRRGQAELAVNLPEEAKRDFQRVLELDPKNSAAVQQLAICEKKVKENVKKEKAMYTKMFGCGGDSGDAHQKDSVSNGMKNASEANGTES